jgi:hypothetical protein
LALRFEGIDSTVDAAVSPEEEGEGSEGGDDADESTDESRLVAGGGAAVELLSGGSVEVGELSAEVVHEAFSLIAADECEGGIKVVIAAELDGLGDLVELGLGEAGDVFHEGGRQLVLLSPSLQVVDALPNMGDGFVVRLEVLFIAGKEIAALAGFRVVEQDEKVIDRFGDLEGIEAGLIGRGDAQAHPVDDGDRCERDGGDGAKDEEELVAVVGHSTS